MAQVKVTAEATLFEHYENGTLEEAVIKAAAEQVLTGMQDKVDRQVLAMVKGAAAAVVKAQVLEAVRGPYRQTNAYGEDAGKSITLAEMIRQQVNAQVGGGYNEPRQTFLEKTIHDAVKAALQNELKGMADEARAKFKKALDDVVVATLRDNLKKALGLPD